MSLPVTSIVNEIHQNADAEMVASMLAHMAVDRSMSHSPNDAREALTHAACDAIKSFTESLPSHQRPQGGGGQAMMLPSNMKQFPLYISALLKSEAFRTNFVEPDTRSFLLHDIKQQPAQFSKQHWHPDLYRVDNITEYSTVQKNDLTVPQVSLLPLSAQYLAKEHVFILDIGWTLLILITVHAPRSFFTDVLGVESFGVLQDGGVFDVPDEPDSEDEDSDEPQSRNRFRSFILSLQEDRPHAAPLQIIRDDGRSKPKFITRLVQDRTDSQALWSFHT